MNASRHFQFCAVAALAVLGAGLRLCGVTEAQDDQPAASDGVQVLTRGPIHEAFAQTVTFNPEPGIRVPNAPPSAIEELPPDQRPEGDHVAWIPGYWAWDDDRRDFLWVSGIWRALPTGRQWIPGNWSPSGNEYQWASGYWADANLNEAEYLTEPPATLEIGANSAPPSANHIWIPGSWMWNQSRYAWRPGYWAPAQQNWMWVPAHYIWSPRGYVFVDGYYDYTVARRGVMFAPVYFDPSVYAQQGFTYTPAMAINPAVFGSQLFLRPNYNHYYFGDYYGSNDSTAGYQPWFAFNSGGYGYDPFYAQQAWQNRQNPGWAQTIQTDFQNRVDNESARPARTLADQQAQMTSGDTSSKTNLVVASSLVQMSKSKESPLRLQPVTKEEQQGFSKIGQAVQQFHGSLQKSEAKTAERSAEKPVEGNEPTKITLPKSPIVAKSADQLGKDHIPPKTHEPPTADPKIEPKPRQAAVTGDLPKRQSNTGSAEPKVDTKPNSKVEPKPTPKIEPVPIPKPESKTIPRVEPKPIPKVEPKPTPKVVPKPEQPNVEPKPVPKAEQKPERPKVEPKLTSTAEKKSQSPMLEPKS